MSKPDLVGLPITSKAATPEYQSGWERIWGKKDDVDADRPSTVLPDGAPELSGDSHANGGHR